MWNEKQKTSEIPKNKNNIFNFRFVGLRSSRLVGFSVTIPIALIHSNGQSQQAKRDESGIKKSLMLGN